MFQCVGLVENNKVVREEVAIVVIGEEPYAEGFGDVRAGGPVPAGSDPIAVAAGSVISQYVDPRYLSYIAGAGFIIIGIWTILQAA